MQIADPESETQTLEDNSQPMKQFPAGIRRRLSGKLAPSQLPNSSSRSSLSESSPSGARPEEHGHSSNHANRHQYHSEKLLAQVGDWLEHERKKASSKKSKYSRRRKSKSPPKEEGVTQLGDNKGSLEGIDKEKNGRQRVDSIDSQESEISFDKLQQILERSLSDMGLSSVPHFSPKAARPRTRKTPSQKSLRGASSDTDYNDGDALVPSCDAWLDNSKTMSYSTGSTEDLTLGSNDKAEKERENWISFKNEIIRIAHTLRLKGWRSVPLEGGKRIWVERLSGALTNAVYVVSPPTDLPDIEGKRKPTKILLRVYGPQVEHLIDRNNELSVLQRLARKKIGPRLLGTFQNGRFEQYFDSITLTPSDIRDPDMSKQIAKRMRELHDGIDLLPHEREGGPIVFKNWDQWLENVDRVASFLDKEFERAQAQQQLERRESVVHAWKAGGYICGTPWPQFKEMFEKYRRHLESFYNGKEAIKKRLVFAHSDVSKTIFQLVAPTNHHHRLNMATSCAFVPMMKSHLFFNRQTSTSSSLSLILNTRDPTSPATSSATTSLSGRTTTMTQLLPGRVPRNDTQPLRSSVAASKPTSITDHDSPSKEMLPHHDWLLQTATCQAGLVRLFLGLLEQALVRSSILCLMPESPLEVGTLPSGPTRRPKNSACRSCWKRRGCGAVLIMPYGWRGVSSRPRFLASTTH